MSQAQRLREVVQSLATEVDAYSTGLAVPVRAIAGSDAILRPLAGAVAVHVSALGGELASGTQTALDAATVLEWTFLSADQDDTQDGDDHRAIEHLLGSLKTLARSAGRLAASAGGSTIDWAVDLLEADGAADHAGEIADLRSLEAELCAWVAVTDEALTAVRPDWSERVDHLIVLYQAALEDAVSAVQGMLVEPAAAFALDKLRETFDAAFAAIESLRQAWNQAFELWGQRLEYVLLPLSDAPNVVFLPRQYRCDGMPECPCDGPSETVDWATGQPVQSAGNAPWPPPQGGSPAQPPLPPADSLFFAESWRELKGVEVARIQQTIADFRSTRNAVELAQAGLPGGSIALNARIDIRVDLTDEGKALANAAAGIACTGGLLLDLVIPGLGTTLCSWAATTAAALTVFDKELLTAYAQAAENAPGSVPFRLNLSPRVESGRVCIWQQMEQIPDFENIAEMAEMSDDAVEELTNQMEGERVALAGLPAPLPPLGISQMVPNTVPWFFPATVAILGNGFAEGGTVATLRCLDADLPEVAVQPILVLPNVIIGRIDSIGQGIGAPSVPPGQPPLFGLQVTVRRQMEGQEEEFSTSATDPIAFALASLENPLPAVFSSTDLRRAAEAGLPQLCARQIQPTEPPLASDHVIPMWAMPGGRAQTELEVDFAHQEGARFFRFDFAQAGEVEEVPLELASASAHVACVANATEVPGFLVPLQPGVRALNGCQLLQVEGRPAATVSPASSPFIGPGGVALVPDGIAPVAPDDAIEFDAWGLPVETPRCWLLVLPWGEHVRITCSARMTITANMQFPIIVNAQDAALFFEIQRTASSLMLYGTYFNINLNFQVVQGRFQLTALDLPGATGDDVIGLPAEVRARYRWFLRLGDALHELDTGAPIPGASGENFQGEIVVALGTAVNLQDSVLSVFSDQPPQHARIVCRREPLEWSVELGQDVQSGDIVEEEIEVSVGLYASQRWGLQASKYPPPNATPAEKPKLPSVPYVPPPAAP